MDKFSLKINYYFLHIFIINIIHNKQEHRKLLKKEREGQKKEKGAKKLEKKILCRLNVAMLGAHYKYKYSSNNLCVKPSFSYSLPAHFWSCMLI